MSVQAAPSDEEKRQALNELKDEEMLLVDMKHLLDPDVSLLEFSTALSDLADAVVSDRPGVLAPLLERGGAPLRPLLEALRRADEALVESLQAAVEVLRGEGQHRASGLAAAQQAVEDRLEELGATPGAIPDLTAEERRRLLVEFDARRRLVLRQRAIEDWLAEWQLGEER